MFDDLNVEGLKPKSIDDYKLDYMDYMDSYTQKVYGTTYDKVNEICDFVDSKTIELEERELKYMPLKLFRKGKILKNTYDIAEDYYN